MSSQPVNQDNEAAYRHAIVVNLMHGLEVFWHYGQVIPLEARRKLSKLVAQIPIHPNRSVLINEMADLLVEHEVEIVFRSKHKEISFRPLGVSKDGTIDTPYQCEPNASGT